MTLGLVAAVVAGLLAVPDGSDGSHEPAPHRLRNLAPFDRALANLATARGLRYTDTTTTGTTRRDITVTPSGTLFGSTGDGAQGLDRDVLRIGGKTFTRRKKAPDHAAPPQGEQRGPDAPAALDAPETPDTPDASGRWTLAPAESDALGPAPTPFRPPAELARELRDAVGELTDLPAPDDPDLPPLQVHGVPALRADTPAGSLLVARNKPYRVLRLVPHARPRRHGDSQGTDLYPISGVQAESMYDTLEAHTRQLADAVDGGIAFTVHTDDGNVSCGTDGCTVSQYFTGELTSDATTRPIGSTVTAVMRATVTIDGRDAGACTSSRSAFPLADNTVSGTLSCSDPGAGPVFAAVEAEYQAQAEAESRASGGPPVPRHFSYVASPVVDAAALTTGEVDKLVKQVQQEHHERFKRQDHGR